MHHSADDELLLCHKTTKCWNTKMILFSFFFSFWEENNNLYALNRNNLNEYSVSFRDMISIMWLF